MPTSPGLPGCGSRTCVEPGNPLKALAMARRRDAAEKEAHPSRVEEVLRRSETQTSISLSGMGLVRVPSALRHAIKLKVLDLGNNRLSELPDWLNELPALEYIVARGNPWRTLPPGPAEVMLDPADVLALPPEAAIERLCMHVGPDDSPDAMIALLKQPDKLARLQRLSLGTSETPDARAPQPLPDVFRAVLDAIHAFNGLRTLDVRGLALHELPHGIASLQNIRDLSACRIGLKTLPRWLAHLPLERLDLSSNILSGLPDWLPEMRRLSTLWLVGNERLKRLPPSVFDMPALKVLGLMECPIREIPSDILRADKLSYLAIDEVRLESPPPEVATQGLDAIRDYWRQRDEAGIDYLCEAKLIILGEGGAGKSTLVRKILDPTCAVDPQEMSTEGIDVARYQFPTTIRPRASQGAADGSANATPPQALQRDFQVNIWDFGGQEIYHATHQFFLTRRSVYLLVCDDRKEDTDFAYWLQAVEALSDGSPLLIIQNEKQDRSRDIGLADLRGRFANLRGAWATNLASNRGLPEVLHAIRRELESLPHVGTPLPATWKRVRQALEQDPRDTLGLNEYLDLCEQHGFNRRDDKLMLSQYLHDLGICLHFQDDAVLKHTIVLKPSWGTDAVYRVLDDPTVKAARGRFSRADLSRIWCEAQYQGMQDELLRLMAKFQLCYALDAGEQRWMAPQLLSADRPAYDWPATGSLVVSWRYDFMPKGLLTRFIVAQHHLMADGAPVWRAGVVLSRDGTRAEVVEDYARRRIVVRVQGDDARGLLAIVDDRIQQLNQAFPRLKVQRWLPCPCAECRAKPEPEAFALDKLTKMALRDQDIQCHESGEMVSATELLREVLPSVLQKAATLRTDLFFTDRGVDVAAGAAALAERPSRATPAESPKPAPAAPTTPEVLVSYASSPDTKALVAQLDQHFSSAGIRLLVDRKDVRYKDSIGQFMQRIANARCVVVIVSKKYLQSEYCMTELVGLLKADNLRERIFPIVLDDAQLYRAASCVAYVAHWEKEIADLDAELKRVRGDNLARLQAKLTEYSEFRRLFDDLSDTLRDMHALSPEEHAESGYAALLAAVRAQLGLA